MWGEVLEVGDGIRWGRGLFSISGSLLSSWGWGGQASLGGMKGEAEGEWSVGGIQRGSREWEGQGRRKCAKPQASEKLHGWNSPGLLKAGDVEKKDLILVGPSSLVPFSEKGKALHLPWTGPSSGQWMSSRLAGPCGR